MILFRTGNWRTKTTLRLSSKLKEQHKVQNSQKSCIFVRLFRCSPLKEFLDKRNTLQPIKGQCCYWVYWRRLGLSLSLLKVGASPHLLTCNLINIWFFSRQFFSGNVSNWSKDGYRSQESSWREIRWKNFKKMMPWFIIFTYWNILSWKDRHHGRGMNYLLEEQLFHKLGTWSELAELTGPLCFFEDFSWSYEALGISRSQLGLHLLFLEVCTVHWLTAQL